MVRLVPLRQILLLAAIAFVTTVTGCGDDDEPVAPAAESAAVQPPAPATDPSGNSLRPLVPKRKADDAAGRPALTLRDQLRVEVARPSNYPSDAPVYPGATTNQTMDDQGIMNVTFSTSDTPGEVAGFMQSELESMGWESVRTEAVPGSPGSITVGFKGNRKISVLAAGLDEGQADAVTMIMVRIEG